MELVKQENCMKFTLMNIQHTLENMLCYNKYKDNKLS